MHFQRPQVRSNGCQIRHVSSAATGNTRAPTRSQIGKYQIVHACLIVEARLLKNRLPPEYILILSKQCVSHDGLKVSLQASCEDHVCSARSQADSKEDVGIDNYSHIWVNHIQNQNGVKYDTILHFQSLSDSSLSYVRRVAI